MILMRPPQQGHASWFDIPALACIITVAVRRRSGCEKQASTERKFFGPMTVSQDPVVANAMEAVRQYVKEKAADELGDLHPRYPVLPSVALSVVVPTEADVGLVKTEQATIGDRHAMRVPRKVRQDCIGVHERPFRIDDPFGGSQRSYRGGKYRFIVELDEIGKELQLAGFVCRHQIFEEQLSETLREPVRSKELRLTGNPALAIRRKTATGNDAV